MKFIINCIFSEDIFNLNRINIFTPKSNVDFNTPACLSGHVLYHFHYPTVSGNGCAGFYGLIANKIFAIPSGITNFSHSTGVVPYTGYVCNMYASAFYEKSGDLFNITMFGLDDDTRKDVTSYYDSSLAYKRLSCPDYAIQSCCLINPAYWDYYSSYFWHIDGRWSYSCSNLISLNFDPTTETWFSKQRTGSCYFNTNDSNLKSTSTGRSVMLHNTMCSGSAFGFDFEIKPSKEYIYDKCNSIFYKIQNENLSPVNIAGATEIEFQRNNVYATKNYITGTPCVTTLSSYLNWYSFISDDRPSFVSYDLCRSKMQTGIQSGVCYTKFEFYDPITNEDVNEYSTYSFNLAKNFCEDKIFKITSINENNQNEYSISAVQFCTGKFKEIETEYSDYFTCHSTLSFDVAYSNAAVTSFQLKSPLIYDLSYIKKTNESDCIQFSWNNIECAQYYNLYIERPSNISDSLLVRVNQSDSKYFYNNRYYYQIEIPAASKQAGTYSISIEAGASSAATSLRTCKCVSTLDY
jgi:hypothetical protein